jgi:Flp pilus assembly protein TadD
MAQLLGEHGRYEDAIAPLQRATSLDQTSFDAWHDLGLTYFRLQRYADARAPLEKAVALRPDYFESVNLLAGDLYLLGDYAAAIPMLERAHRLKPSDAQLADVLDKLRRNQQQK